MNMQEYLDKTIQASRYDKFSKSDQLSLGGIIQLLEPIAGRQGDVAGEHNEEALVQFDFGYLFPTSIDSWRGSYNELALNYKSEGELMYVSAFLDMLKKAVGTTFTGYKGGDYVMNRSTPVWVANGGDSGNTAVIGIVDDDYRVLIMTGYREF